MVEIARKLFVSLNYCNRDHKYFVLNDGNYMFSFYADNDEKAKELFEQRIYAQK